jgi:hypothetical protein
MRAAPERTLGIKVGDVQTRSLTIDLGRRGIIGFASGRGLLSGPCRDRTYDLGIKSPLLYQLS